MKGRSGMRHDPWSFYLSKKKDFKDPKNRINADYDMYFSMNRASKEGTSNVGVGLCRACIYIED